MAPAGHLLHTVAAPQPPAVQLRLPEVKRCGTRHATQASAPVTHGTFLCRGWQGRPRYYSVRGTERCHRDCCVRGGGPHQHHEGTGRAPHPQPFASCCRSLAARAPHLAQPPRRRCRLQPRRLNPKHPRHRSHHRQIGSCHQKERQTRQIRPDAV